VAIAEGMLLTRDHLKKNKTIFETAFKSNSLNTEKDKISKY